ncbi:hypothetical protein EHT87_20150 [Larkinella knui]|uniref:Uncharacterized protein n=2 Tax=Larkinella knui TaxID=2025310 RepID=A0A3P1CI32_9BACT|nr:hypothetical protein EHT87_20150 [Larkinella knui]
MNHAGFGVTGWRYALLWLLTGAVVMACQNAPKTDEPEVINQPGFPLTNPTRALVNTLEARPLWSRLLTYYQRNSRRKSESVLQYGEPFILGLKDSVLTLAENYKPQTLLYINGKAASMALLAKLKMNYVEDLFILHQFDGIDNPDPHPYRILIQISDRSMPLLPGRYQLMALLQASAISDHPLGTTHVFTMNKLLEATFFGYKNVFVKRTKNQHLKVQDEYINDIAVFINGIPVDPKEVETVHVREVDRLYTRERPFTAWMRSKKRENRYALFIKTSPKRAQRDSSYYVFSPFYSGDF